MGHRSKRLGNPVVRFRYNTLLILCFSSFLFRVCSIPLPVQRRGPNSGGWLWYIKRLPDDGISTDGGRVWCTYILQLEIDTAKGQVGKKVHSNTLSCLEKDGDVSAYFTGRCLLSCALLVRFITGFKQQSLDLRGKCSIWQGLSLSTLKVVNPILGPI